MTQNKDQKYEALSEAVLKLLSIHGEEGLKIAKVARAANVSRPWIYKYIGDLREDLVDLAMDRFAKILSPSLLDMKLQETPKEWIDARLRSTRHFLQVMQAYPYAITLYYRYRGSQTHYGKLIERQEQAYHAIFCKQAQKALKLSHGQALFFSQTFLAIRFGLAHQLKTSKNKTADIERLLRLTEAILLKMVQE